MNSEMASPSNEALHAVDVHNIVVLDGSLGGSSVAHYLLRHVVPHLNSASSYHTYKVTLVSPSTHFFFKVGAPRALTTADIPPEKSFYSIPDVFKDYEPSHFHLPTGRNLWSGWCGAICVNSAARRGIVKDRSGVSYSRDRDENNEQEPAMNTSRRQHQHR
jgi:hypothetical protein